MTATPIEKAIAAIKDAMDKLKYEGFETDAIALEEDALNDIVRLP